VRLATATALSILGLPLLVARWPVPMIGLAFLCSGALLSLTAASTARAKKRR
jgi:hypothetical protein